MTEFSSYFIIIILIFIGIMALPLDLTSLWTALSGASSPPLVAAAREALACAAAHEGAQPEVEVRLGRMSGSAGGGGESFVAGLAQAEWEAAQSALYQRSGWKSAPTEVRPHTFSLLARVAFFRVRRLPSPAPPKPHLPSLFFGVT